MKLRSQNFVTTGKKEINIVKNDLSKENIVEGIQSNITFSNGRKRLCEEKINRHLLGVRENKIAKLEEHQMLVSNKKSTPEVGQPIEVLPSKSKRKRIPSTSNSTDLKKIRLSLEVNDVDKGVEHYSPRKISKTTKELYGFLFTSTQREDIEVVFVEDRLYTLLEKEAYLLTSPIVDISLSPNGEGLQQRCYYQYAIVKLVMERFHFQSSTGLLAMSIFDDCWRRGLVTSSNCRAITIVSVYIAAKYEEVMLPSIDDLLMCIYPYHTRNDIIETEILILNAIDFNVIRPLSLEIGRYFSIDLKYPEKGNFILDYICFVTAADNKTAHLKPSTIASCAVIITCELLNISPGNQRLLLMKEVTENGLQKFLPLICQVVIDYLQLFINAERDQKSNTINIIFDKKRYNRSTKYLYSKLPQLIGFYEDLVESFVQ
uniref:Cyclin N-terminal domain-containing protein n=1 Tax=Strongyloides stercoralis TaxID=6248 RepID=A0A0K0EJY5_STRER